MKLVRKYLLIIIAAGTLFFMNSSSSKAQISIQAGIGGGVSIPSGDLSGNTIEYYSGQNYGLSSGFNVHGKARLGFLGFSLFGEFGYSSFSNNGEAEPGKGKIDLSQHIVSLKVGPEFHISIPLSPIEPYVNANVAYNSIRGTTTFQGVSEVPSNEYTVESASRFGIGFGGGIIFSLGPATSLDISVDYNLMNLIGKSWDAAGDKRIDSYQSLNDDKDPLFEAPDHFVENSRSISTMNISATLMFGL